MKRIWVDESILSQNTLRSIQKKMDEFQVPADLGRIPGKIYSGEGFTNFTADQWKNFFLIYATVVLWDHLSSIDRKILTYFVRVCTILVRRIVDVNEMEEAHMGLIEIIRLIEKKYGEGKYHLIFTFRYIYENAPMIMVHYTRFGAFRSNE